MSLLQLVYFGPHLAMPVFIVPFAIIFALMFLEIFGRIMWIAVESRADAWWMRQGHESWVRNRMQRKVARWNEAREAGLYDEREPGEPCNHRVCHAMSRALSWLGVTAL